MWRAWDLKGHRWVAVKVFSGRGGDAGAWRFVREQHLELEHPSIIAVLDFGTDYHGSYLVMELLPAGTLEDYITERGALAPDLVLLWGEQLLDALAACAAAGVIHRDVKPANLMLRVDPEGPRLVLADFGQAWVDDGVELTLAPDPVGTPGYIAPELTGPNAVATPAADIYAAGVTLRRALSGGGPETPLPATTPTEVVDLINRLTADDPGERPTDGAALCRNLRATREAAGLAPSGMPHAPSHLARPPDPYRRRKIGAGLATLLLVNALVAWAVTRPDPPPPPPIADPASVAWSLPSLQSNDAFAVGDDGTVFTADANRGVIYRVAGQDIVPVAGGGNDRDGEGDALDLDLRSAFIDQSVNDPTDVFSTTRWELAVDPDGSLWLNTGDIWHLEPGGEGRRVLRVPADGEGEADPYRVFIVNTVDDPGEVSVFNAKYLIEAIPSPIRPRGSGIDFIDDNSHRIAHLAADGTVTDTCVLEGVRQRGKLPDGYSSVDDDGGDTTVDRQMTPASFVVIGPNDCWVVDSATGELAHVVGGGVTARIYGVPGDGFTTSPTWTTDLAASGPPLTDLRWGQGRTELLGPLPDGRVLAQLATSSGGGALGVFSPDSNDTGRTIPFEKADTLSPGSVPADVGAWLRVAPSGHKLAGIFGGVTAVDTSDPRAAVASSTVAVLDTRVLVEQDALRFPALVADPATPSPYAAYAARFDTAIQLTDPLEFEEGLPSDQVTTFGTFGWHLAMTDDAAIGAEDNSAFVWAVDQPPDDRLRLVAALRPEGSSMDAGCSIHDIAVDPTRPVAAVLCGSDEIVEVQLGAAIDESPETLAGPDAFDDATRAVAEQSGDGVTGIGPGLSLDYDPDGRLVLSSYDEGAAFEVTSGELRLLTGFADDDPDLTGLEDIDDDPVLVRAWLEEFISSLEGTEMDRCAGSTDDVGPFYPRDTVALGDGQLLGSDDRCLMVITPGDGTDTFDTGDAPARGFTHLARSEDHVLAFNPFTSEIWRFDLHGGGAELVAGRRLVDGSAPDGTRAAGSPIDVSTGFAATSDGLPCWDDSIAGAVRCVDEHGAFTTVMGAPVQGAGG